MIRKFAFQCMFLLFLLVVQQIFCLLRQLICSCLCVIDPKYNTIDVCLSTSHSFSCRFLCLFDFISFFVSFFLFSIYTLLFLLYCILIVISQLKQFHEYYFYSGGDTDTVKISKPVFFSILGSYFCF